MKKVAWLVLPLLALTSCGNESENPQSAALSKDALPYTSVYEVSIFNAMSSGISIHLVGTKTDSATGEETLVEIPLSSPNRNLLGGTVLSFTEDYLDTIYRDYSAVSLQISASGLYSGCAPISVEAREQGSFISIDITQNGSSFVCSVRTYTTKAEMTAANQSKHYSGSDQ